MELGKRDFAATPVTGRIVRFIPITGSGTVEVGELQFDFKLPLGDFTYFRLGEHVQVVLTGLGRQLLSISKVRA